MDSDRQVSDTPAGSGFVAIAAGFDHGLALKSNGSIISWGEDLFGQVFDSPSGDKLTAIAAGNSHSLALVTTIERHERQGGRWV